MKVAYIIGPYRSETINGIRENIQKAEKVALEYWGKGYAVICPHKNTAFFDGACGDDIFLNGGIEILKRCDIVIILSGYEQSKGSLKEIEIAKNNNIEIIYVYD